MLKDFRDFDHSIFYPRVHSNDRDFPNHLYQAEAIHPEEEPA